MTKAELRKRVEELEVENSSLEMNGLQCLADIREAIGDNGRLMQDELVDRIKEIVAENAKLKVKEFKVKKIDPLVAMRVMGEGENHE